MVSDNRIDMEVGKKVPDLRTDAFEPTDR